MPAYRIREAADLLGVSSDTVRRWAEAGRLSTTHDESGRQVVDGQVLAAFAQELAQHDQPSHGRAPHERGEPESRRRAALAPAATQSVRNRFTGLVTRVVRDTVMAQVEIQAGPHRIVSLISREAADELGLEPGVLAVAAVKSTNVAVELVTPR